MRSNGVNEFNLLSFDIDQRSRDAYEVGDLFEHINRSKLPAGRRRKRPEPEPGNYASSCGGYGGMDFDEYIEMWKNINDMNGFLSEVPVNKWNYSYPEALKGRYVREYLTEVPLHFEIFRNYNNAELRTYYRKFLEAPDIAELNIQYKEILQRYGLEETGIPENNLLIEERKKEGLLVLYPRSFWFPWIDQVEAILREEEERAL